MPKPVSKKVPRSGSAISARSRHAGPMKDRRLKRDKEPEQWDDDTVHLNIDNTIVCGIDPLTLVTKQKATELQFVNCDECLAKSLP